MRWGPGPVFIYECLANSRRWQTYALRAVGVTALLLTMATIARSQPATTASSWRAYANLGQAYFVGMIGVELALVMLAAPAAAAGAICVDRARGTLAHMLMTDLSDTEIVLGKLGARLLPVLGLVACTWPVMAISSLLGGIDPIALTLAFAIIVTVAVLGCTMAIAFSVWARKSHEVTLAAYSVFIAGLLVWPIWFLLASTGKVTAAPHWPLLANPFYLAFAPYTDPGKLGIGDYLVFFGVATLASALLTVLAVWRTRAVACRGSVEQIGSRRIGLIGWLGRWLPGPSLDRDPVLWREWHRSRPSRWMAAIIALLMGTTGALCVAGAIAFWNNGVDFRPGSFWEIAGVCSFVLHVIFGLLMLAAIAPTSMAEERQRGSLDVLAATDLTTREIVIGKWMGTFRLVLLMTIGPGTILLAMATARSAGLRGFVPGLAPEYYRVLTPGGRIYGVVMVIGTIVAHGALLTSVGLALAVWFKRQSRAIALSVGTFVLITAAWPIFVSAPAKPDLGRNLATLSPVVVCTISVNLLSTRQYVFVGDTLASGTFWAVEVFVVAMALLWLTVRTFDGCFDRIADRPGGASTGTVSIVILAGLIAAGSSVWAVDCLIDGIRPAWNLTLGSPASFGILTYAVLLAIGLVLIALLSATPVRPSSTTDLAITRWATARKLVLRRWRASFRWALVLAGGPAVLALAMATAHKPPQYKPQFTTTPAGVQVVTSYVRANPDIPLPGELPLGQRLLLAALLIVTILVHGGAAISVGLALSLVSGWSRRAVAAAIGLAVVVAIVLPLGLVVLYDHRGSDTAMWSLVRAVDSLLLPLATRTSWTVPQTLWAVLYWNIVTAIVTIGLLSGTIWSTRRRFSSDCKTEPMLLVGLDENPQPTIGPGLARE